MNDALKNIFALIIVISTILFGIYFLFSRQQGQYIPDTLIDINCIYPVHIQNDILQPTVKKGVILSMNKCIENRENLKEGYIVLFQEDGRKKLGTITNRQIVENITYYKIDKGLDEEVTIDADSIIAYSVIGTSD